jgi:hypothetical protein
MANLKKIGQFILGAVAATAMVGACKKDDRAQARIDEAKAEAKDYKDQAEKHTEHAKADLDRRLDDTKAAADRKVDEVKADADHVRHEVRGTDDPDRAVWRSHWERFTKSPDARWNADDDWVVERDGKELRAHRRVYDRPAGAPMTDDAISNAVKGRLSVDDDTRPSKIDVDTKDAVVTLKGDVPSNAVAGEAVRLALGTKGVRTVISKLDIH